MAGNDRSGVDEISRGAEEGLEGQRLLEVGFEAPGVVDCKGTDPIVEFDRELQEALGVLQLPPLDGERSSIEFEVVLVDGSLEDDRWEPIVGSAQNIEIRGGNVGGHRVRHAPVGERIKAQCSVVGLDPIAAIDCSIGRRHRPRGVGSR